MHTRSQTLALGGSGGSAAREAQETHRERPSCVTLGRGLDRQPPLPLCQPTSYAVHGQLSSCLCGPLPTLPILNLNWPVRSACPTPCLAGTLPLPTHKLPSAGPLPGTQPALCLFWVPAFMGKQHPSACAACTCQRRHLVVGRWCQPKLQCLLGRS